MKNPGMERGTRQLMLPSLSAPAGSGPSKATFWLGTAADRQVPMASLLHPLGAAFNTAKGPAFAKYCKIFLFFISSNTPKTFGWWLLAHLRRKGLEVSPVPPQRWGKWDTEQDRLREERAHAGSSHRTTSLSPSLANRKKSPSPGQENPLAYSHGANNENTNYISLTYQRDDSFR